MIPRTGTNDDKKGWGSKVTMTRLPDGDLSFVLWSCWSTRRPIEEQDADTNGFISCCISPEINLTSETQTTFQGFAGLRQLFYPHYCWYTPGFTNGEESKFPAVDVHTLTGSVSSRTLALYVMGLQSRVFPTGVHGKNMGPKSSPSSTSTVNVVVAVRRSLG